MADIVDWICHLRVCARSNSVCVCYTCCDTRLPWADPMQRSSRSATVTAIWAGAGVATVTDGAEDIITVGAIITVREAPAVIFVRRRVSDGRSCNRLSVVFLRSLSSEARGL